MRHVIKNRRFFVFAKALDTRRAIRPSPCYKLGMERHFYRFRYAYLVGLDQLHTGKCETPGSATEIRNNLTLAPSFLVDQFGRLRDPIRYRRRPFGATLVRVPRERRICQSAMIGDARRRRDHPDLIIWGARRIKGTVWMIRWRLPLRLCG